VTYRQDRPTRIAFGRSLQRLGTLESVESIGFWRTKAFVPIEYAAAAADNANTRLLVVVFFTRMWRNSDTQQYSINCGWSTESQCISRQHEWKSTDTYTHARTNTQTNRHLHTYTHIYHRCKKRWPQE